MISLAGCNIHAASSQLSLHLKMLRHYITQSHRLIPHLSTFGNSSEKLRLKIAGTPGSSSSVTVKVQHDTMDL